MSNITLQINQQKNLPNKKAFLESIQEKTKMKSQQERNLINLQSSIYIDASKYISIGLNCQQNEDFENSKVSLEKGVSLIREIMNNNNNSINNDQYLLGKNSLTNEYVIFYFFFLFKKIICYI